jgi:alpha-1,3-rhamnosyltransferase
MTESQTLVSIVIPCYNHDKYVQEAIQSVIEQDYSNIELVIIDDGSEDDSVTKIKEMIQVCQKRFKRFEFRHRPNKGLCATLNEALAWCEGEFFSPLASDDIALPHKTSFLVSKISGSTYSAVFGIAKRIGLSTNVHNTNKTYGEHHFKDLILQKNMPTAPAAMIRKTHVLESGGYSKDVKLEDWYMWLLLTSNSYVIKSFNEVVVLYRDHESNTVKDTIGMYYSKLQVIEKFKSNPLYPLAIKENNIISARFMADKNIVLPIKLIFHSKECTFRTFFIVFKALMPRFIVKIWRLLK